MGSGQIGPGFHARFSGLGHATLRRRHRPRHGDGFTVGHQPLATALRIDRCGGVADSHGGNFGPGRLGDGLIADALIDDRVVVTVDVIVDDR
jgi:hypothetical protein